MKLTYCVLAGGCFWCIAYPYYNLDGVKKVYSGYSGGEEINPSYKEVKSQKTTHRECIKIEYDEDVISYEEILNLFFENINPFDDGGQFIDRGFSYTTAIFYRDEMMLETINKIIEKVEISSNQKVAVQVLKEDIFYLAEDEHQEYALKNPEAMEQELIESGRKVK